MSGPPSQSVPKSRARRLSWTLAVVTALLLLCGLPRGFARYADRNESREADKEIDRYLPLVQGRDPAGAGLTTQNETEAATNRVLIERSRKAIVVADSSKLGRVVFAGIAPLSAISELITDAGADPAEVDRLRTAGLTVTVV